MGAACSIKEKSKGFFSGSQQRSNSRIGPLVTKHSSQFRDAYSKYHLFENRWTTIRVYQKLPFMVLRNFKKVLERGVSKGDSRDKDLGGNIAPPNATSGPNFLLTPVEDFKPNSSRQTNNNYKTQINDNVFWCDQEPIFLNKMRTLNPDNSMETNEFSEFSNLVFINVNYKSPLDLGDYPEEKAAKQKLNNILGTLSYL